eukprot:TRINITY_DN42806_c0_g1_i1.p1 TRINITY_DN42806_c0_g1~~TRINITY_DN42806_c0_g1_i1.p1  ORF type:complete len:432 (+),score=46.56 TRINITY_DN42806_c0_g1_i1:112-1407(+)
MQHRWCQHILMDFEAHGCRRHLVVAIILFQVYALLGVAADIGNCVCSPALALRLPKLERWLRAGRLDWRGANRYCPTGHFIKDDCLQGVMLESVACVQAAALGGDSDLDGMMEFFVVVSEQAFRRCQQQILSDFLPLHLAEVTLNFNLHRKNRHAFVFQKLPMPQLAEPALCTKIPEMTAEASRLEILASRWAWDTFAWHRQHRGRNHSCVGGDFHCRKYGHCYAPVFAPALPAPPPLVQRVLELGVCGGASLGMWAEFFQNSTVVGVDISMESFSLGWPEVRHRLGKQRAERVKVIAANYTNPLELERIVSHGPYDIVIDDGSHTEEAMYEAFSLFFFAQRGLRPGGLYVIFDVSSALKETGLTRFKHLVNSANFGGEQHRGYTDLNTHLRVTALPEDVWVESVEFRRNAIIIRKRGAVPKDAIRGFSPL